MITCAQQDQRQSRWKHQTRVKAKMQGRTRMLAEYVAPLVATARSRLADAEALLAAVQAGGIDDTVFIVNRGYRIARATGRSGPRKVAAPLDGGRRINPLMRRPRRSEPGPRSRRFGFPGYAWRSSANSPTFLSAATPSLTVR